MLMIKGSTGDVDQAVVIVVEESHIEDCSAASNPEALNKSDAETIASVSPSSSSAASEEVELSFSDAIFPTSLVARYERGLSVDGRWMCCSGRDRGRCAREWQRLKVSLVRASLYSAVSSRTLVLASKRPEAGRGPA